MFRRSLVVTFTALSENDSGRESQVVLPLPFERNRDDHSRRAEHVDCTVAQENRRPINLRRANLQPVVHANVHTAADRQRKIGRAGLEAAAESEGANQRCSTDGESGGGILNEGSMCLKMSNNASVTAITTGPSTNPSTPQIFNPPITEKKISSSCSLVL